MSTLSWCPRRQRIELEQAGNHPLPAPSTVYRILAHDDLVDRQRRRRRREDYRRWERSPGDGAVAGGRHGPGSASPTAASCRVVTGIDDHSRLCVLALLVPKATAKQVWRALVEAMRLHGIHDAALTDYSSNVRLRIRDSAGGGTKLQDDRRLPVLFPDRSDRR